MRVLVISVLVLQTKDNFDSYSGLGLLIGERLPDCLILSLVVGRYRVFFVSFHHTSTGKQPPYIKYSNPQGGANGHIFWTFGKDNKRP